MSSISFCLNYALPPEPWWCPNSCYHQGPWLGLYSYCSLSLCSGPVLPSRVMQMCMVYVAAWCPVDVFGLTWVAYVKTWGHNDVCSSHCIRAPFLRSLGLLQLWAVFVVCGVASNDEEVNNLHSHWLLKTRKLLLQWYWWLHMHNCGRQRILNIV